MDRNYDRYFNNGNLPAGYEDPGEQMIPSRPSIQEEDNDEPEEEEQ